LQEAFAIFNRPLQTNRVPHCTRIAQPVQPVHNTIFDTHLHLHLHFDLNVTVRVLACVEGLILLKLAHKWGRK
ncbi:hypothetical protein PHLCEN_2v4820, partial [Hermanssonia centrifuga]